MKRDDMVSDEDMAPGSMDVDRDDEYREQLIHRYTCVIIVLIYYDSMYIMYTYLAIIS